MRYKRNYTASLPRMGRGFEPRPPRCRFKEMKATYAFDSFSNGDDVDPNIERNASDDRIRSSTADWLLRAVTKPSSADRLPLMTCPMCSKIFNTQLYNMLGPEKEIFQGVSL